MDDRPTRQSAPTGSPTGPVRLGAAIQAGISKVELRGGHWARVSHGVYAPANAGYTPQSQYAHVAPILPPDALAAHLTAAREYRLWLPNLPNRLPILANLPPGRDRPERAGLYVFRSRAALPPARLVGSTPCVPPAVCLGQLAEDLSLLDLIVAIDAALHHRLCTVEQITAAIRSRQRGLPRLRKALALCDPRSESPWETVLRLLHVVCGIPVESQFTLRTDDGEVIARADLRIRGTSRLPEYDGATHRDRARHERDLVRDKILARNGLQRYGYIASEILSDPAHIIRDAEDALGWPRSASRIGEWWPVIEESSLSEMGRQRLLRRLARFSRPLRGRGSRRAPSATCQASPDPGLRETG